MDIVVTVSGALVLPWTSLCTTLILALFQLRRPRKSNFEGSHRLLFGRARPRGHNALLRGVHALLGLWIGRQKERGTPEDENQRAYRVHYQEARRSCELEYRGRYFSPIDRQLTPGSSSLFSFLQHVNHVILEGLFDSIASGEVSCSQIEVFMPYPLAQRG